MKLMGKFFGSKKLSDLDDKIDNLINLIPPKAEDPSSEDSTGKIVDSFLSQSSDDDVGKLFQNVSIPQQRISRYNLYDEMNRSIPIIKRIIKVYIANILPKNPVDGKSVVYRQAPDIADEKKKFIDTSKTFCKQALEEFRLIEKYKQFILPRRLLYGDCFVEVVDLLKETENVNLNQANFSVMTEVSRLQKDMNNSSSNIEYIFSRTARCLLDFEDVVDVRGDSTAIIETDQLVNNQEKDADAKVSDKLDGNKKSNVKGEFSDILLKIHKPHNILILDTQYGSRFGFLEIMQKNEASVSNNLSQSLSKTIGKLTTMSKQNNMNQDQMVNKLIFHVLKQIVEKVRSENNNVEADTETIVRSLGDDVYKFVKRLFVEQGIYRKTSSVAPLKVRFIPSSRMVQFNNPSVDYTPYGESVIESLILPCKLYMLAQLSNAITKLSRASVIRKWRLDVGSSRMHSQLIQKLKRELYNTRVTLDDLSSFKSIPKILSDFKDMFVITQGGQTPVDVDIQQMGDASIKTADLEDARREIIALSGIPAPYLGYMDVVELREQLVHSNVSFATEITDMQENDIRSLNQLIDIIAEVKNEGYRPSEYITVGLIPPVVLILQLIEMTLSSVGNISGVFQQMGIQIDPYFFLKQYVPHIDWDKFEDQSLQKQLDDKTKAEMGDTGEQSGGGGMY